MGTSVCCGASPWNGTDVCSECKEHSDFEEQTEETQMVRAKFVVQVGSKKVHESDGCGTVHLLPVYSGSKENDEFFKYTPGGQIDLTIMNPNAMAQFEEGKEYYVDFTPAQ